MRRQRANRVVRFLLWGEIFFRTSSESDCVEDSPDLIDDLVVIVQHERLRGHNCRAKLSHVTSNITTGRGDRLESRGNGGRD